MKFEILKFVEFVEMFTPGRAGHPAGADPPAEPWHAAEDQPQDMSDYRRRARTSSGREVDRGIGATEEMMDGTSKKVSRQTRN